MILTQLQKLSEAASTGTRGAQKLSKDVLKLSEKTDDLYDELEKLVAKLESDVLTGQFSAAGFPATQHNDAKRAARKAYDALGKLANELQDLHMSVVMHQQTDFDE